MFCWENYSEGALLNVKGLDPDMLGLSSGKRKGVKEGGQVLRRVSWIAFVGLLFISPVLAQVPGGTSLSERAERGRKIFDRRCYICHQRDSERVKSLGPPMLDGLFKRERLIIGKPVTAENVKEIIRTGPTPGMPAFRYTLSDPEIDDLIEYLKTK